MVRTATVIFEIFSVTLFRCAFPLLGLATAL